MSEVPKLLIIALAASLFTSYLYPVMEIEKEPEIVCFEGHEYWDTYNGFAVRLGDFGGPIICGDDYQRWDEKAADEELDVYREGEE